MNKLQRGFVAVETLLILIIIGIIGGTGYYVWHTKSQTNKNLDTAQSETSSIASKITNISKPHLYTNSSVGYSVELPAGWNFIKGQPMKLQDGTVDKDYKGDPILAPDTIRPIGEDQTSVDGIDTVWTDSSTMTAKDYFVQNGVGRANYIDGTGTETTINGYSAFIANMGGQTTSKVVTFAHNGKIVEFSYYTSSLNKHLDLTEQIVNSIKFTN